MIMTEKLSLSDFVSRLLHPGKLTVDFLNSALERNTDGDLTMVNSSLLNSAIQTIELFVEDYEKLIEKTGPAAAKAAVERKFVGEEPKPQPAQ